MDLLYLSTDRGTDATGFAIREGKTITIVKEPIAADKFIKKYAPIWKEKINKSNMVIGHTRAATQGHPKDNENNHPVYGDKFVMIHNGMCPMMDRIKGYKYHGQVDSEILLSHIERRGIKEGLKALKGSASIALMAKDDPNSIYLWRHSNPLWVAYDAIKKTIFFASTQTILTEGLSNLLTLFSTFQFREISEDYLYKITFKPLNIELIDQIEPNGWKSNYQKTSSYTTPYSAYGDYDFSNETYTGTIDTTTPSTKAGSSIEGVNKIYEDLMKLKWDRDLMCFTRPDSILPKDNRYYYNGQSIDYSCWTRLKGGGHISLDRKLIKLYDQEKRSHFIIPLQDAISEQLISLDNYK